MTDQTARPVRTLDETRTCGHTTQQHRADDGQAADTRSQDQAVRVLTAERDQARNDLKRATHTIDTQAEQLTHVTEERDTALHLVDVRTAALARRTEQRDQLIADLTDAGNEVDLAEADARRLRRALTAVRDGVELIDRALSTVDAAPAQTAAERPNGAGEGTDKGSTATEAHRGAQADDDSLTDRLAGALADALSWFRYHSGPHHYTARIPERSVTAWRAVYAEWADQVAPEGRDDAVDERDHCEDLADAMERAETVRIDSRDVIWRPATIPAGEDQRCWTCSAEPDPAALDEHRPTVAQVLDDVRAGRSATLEQIRREAAQVQAAALADPDADHMTPAYPATTREG